MNSRQCIGFVNAYVFGWLPGNLREYGAADANLPTWKGAGKAAFATAGDLSQRLFAHEMAHLMGVAAYDTSDCPSGDALKDWTYSDATIQEYGLDGNGSRVVVVSPSAVEEAGRNIRLHVHIAADPEKENVWTSPWTYGHIFTETLGVD